MPQDYCAPPHNYHRWAIERGAPSKVLTVKGSNCAAALKLRQGRAGKFWVRVHNQDSVHEMVSIVVKRGGVVETVKVASDQGAPRGSGWSERLERKVSQYSSRWVGFGFTGDGTSASEFRPAANAYVLADPSSRKDIAGEVIAVNSNAWRGCADLGLER